MRFFMQVTVCVVFGGHVKVMKWSKKIPNPKTKNPNSRVEPRVRKGKICDDSGRFAFQNPKIQKSIPIKSLFMSFFPNKLKSDHRQKGQKQKNRQSVISRSWHDASNVFDLGFDIEQFWRGDQKRDRDGDVDLRDNGIFEVDFLGDAETSQNQLACDGQEQDYDYYVEHGIWVKG